MMFVALHPMELISLKESNGAKIRNRYNQVPHLIRFARASSYVTDFNTRNKLLTQKLLKQGYRYHKPFLNFIDNTMI